MSKNSLRLVCISLGLAAILLRVSPTPISAQTVSGTILGAIQDQQGAAIPKVDVSARNVETGAVRTTVADESGNYRISSVPAGSYEISASATGFKTEVRRGVVVTVGADVTVPFSLTVGAVSEKVEVTGEATQVDTASSTMGGFVNSTTIRELPLNGRDWLQLALLQPGAVFNTGQNQADTNRPQKGNGVAFSISGGRQSENAYRIDGLVVNDYANDGPGSGLHVNLGVDAIREFSVLTNSYSAEFGRSSGGVINAITKSGTNEYHGSAYYFHRNSALDARNFFDQTIPPFRRHQYGGAIGGAIKKDKTFFFTNYERLTEIRSQSSAADTLSANVHNGIVCANTACNSTSQVAIAPAIKPYLALFPMPNGQVTGNTGKFVYGAARLGDENYVIGKIDHNFSAATTVSGSYSYDDTTVSSPDQYYLKFLLSPSRRQNGIITLQHLFSPTLINSTRVGVSRTWAGGNVDGNPTNPALTDPSLGFVPGRNMGYIIISGVNGGYSGIGANGLNYWGYTAPQAGDDLTWTKGRHTIHSGFSFERIDYNMTSLQLPNGQWNFTSVSSFLQGTPSTFASDFPGSDFIRGMRNSIYGAYVQDDFHMLSNLTLNLGVRYENATVITEVNNKISNLRSIYDPAVSLGDPYYHNPTTKDFTPRIGFAWDPFKNGKTAVRGGFGMFNVLPLAYLYTGRIFRSPPFFNQGNLSNPPPSSFPNHIIPLLNLSTLTTGHVEFNPKRSYRVQWNLNIQRQLTRSLALSLGYVGSSGVHLVHVSEDADQVGPANVTFNQAADSFFFPVPAAGAKPQRINPNFGKIRSSEWSGHSTYHSLQANLVQRPVKGLFYQVAYTWSKSLDDGTSSYTETESSNTAAMSYFFNQRMHRGVSEFDLPHNLVANFQYDLPVPSAVKSHRVTNSVMNGWQVGGIYTRQSGAPFTGRIAADRAGTGSSAEGGSSGGQRPMYVNAPGCSPNATTGDIDHYILTQCFAFPAVGQLGNLGRNTFRMPVFRDLDFTVFKNQNLWGERLKAQFRVEMFNVLNNTNLQTQTVTIFDGAGKLTSTIGTPAAPTVNTSRQIQFGLRLVF